MGVLAFILYLILACIATVGIFILYIMVRPYKEVEYKLEDHK